MRLTLKLVATLGVAALSLVHPRAAAAQASAPPQSDPLPMLRFWRSPLLLICLALLTACATTASAGRDGAAPRNLHIFLLAGQSNMAGRGEVEAADQQTHPRIWMFDRSGAWVPAAEPLHFDKPIAGVGPGLSFARALVELDPDVIVGLVPAAAGGSPITSWQPGGYHEQTLSHPYDDALARTREALRAGELKAILWHQGESDASSAAAPLYRERLVGLVQRFRADLGAPGVPFLVGGLGCFEGRPWSPAVVTVDSAHRALPGLLPAVAYVPAGGLGHKGDTLHFDSPAARELGRRYADAYLRLTADAASSSESSPAPRCPPAPAPVRD